jgi:predicted regulator of Ras-like GTPase activity (Roadblock/LC7/MglB family)
MTTTPSQDEIDRILTSLKVGGVRNVSLTTIEGRSLGSTVAEIGARFKLGALSAASVAIATKTSGELGLGELDQIQILSSKGALFLNSVGAKALLSVVADNGIDPLTMTREMRRVTLQLLPLL